MDILAEFVYQKPYIIEEKKIIFEKANNHRSCQTLQQLANLLEQGNAKLINKKYAEAIILFDSGLEQLADKYFSKDIMDDTGIKLILADVALKKGNLDYAANLKHNVLQSRFTLLKDKTLCKIK